MNESFKAAMDAALGSPPTGQTWNSMFFNDDERPQDGFGGQDTALHDSPLPVKEERNANADPREAKRKADSLRPLALPV